MRQQIEQLHSDSLGRDNVVRHLATPPNAGESLLFDHDEKLATGDARSVDELLRIHEYERQRMGQELHDSAGQLLVSLQFSVAHLRRVEGDTGHAELFDEIQDTVRQIEREIRSLAFLHYPVELGDRGLGEAVQSLARGFGRRTGIRTSFKESGDQSIASESISTALLRVAQEALVNVHRHAHASQASVSLKQADNRVEIMVSDNGVGMPTIDKITKAKGIGLRGMRHRIETLGGRFSVRSLKHGTRLTASVPIPA